MHILAICQLLLATIASSNSWLKQSPMYTYTVDGRRFFPFNFLSNNGGFRNKENRLREVERSVLRLSASDTVQNSKIAILDNILANDVAQCPVSATDAKKIGDFCYTVEASEMSFEGSSRNCLKKGGYLAEPSVDESSSLYTSLETEFKSETDTIKGRTPDANKNCYIGLIKAATTQTFYKYLKNGQIINNAHSIFSGAAIADTAANLLAAVIKPGGSNWDRVDGGGSTTLPIDARCSICQYDLV